MSGRNRTSRSLGRLPTKHRYSESHINLLLLVPYCNTVTCLPKAFLIGSGFDVVRGELKTNRLMADNFDAQNTVSISGQTYYIPQGTSLDIVKLSQADMVQITNSSQMQTLMAASFGISLSIHNSATFSLMSSYSTKLTNYLQACSTLWWCLLWSIHCTWMDSQAS